MFPYGSGLIVTPSRAMTPSGAVTPSRGLAFSIAMLVFMLIEIGVLADIERQYISTMMLFFFAGLGFLALLQVAGILLGTAGHYRVGGVIQLIASAVHALDLIGLIGIFGGLAAYRYPERLAKLDRGAAPDRPAGSPQ